MSTLCQHMLWRTCCVFKPTWIYYACLWFAWNIPWTLTAIPANGCRYSHRPWNWLEAEKWCLFQCSFHLELCGMAKSWASSSTKYCLGHDVWFLPSAWSRKHPSTTQRITRNSAVRNQKNGLRQMSETWTQNWGPRFLLPPGPDTVFFCYTHRASLSLDTYLSALSLVFIILSHAFCSFSINSINSISLFLSWSFLCTWSLPGVQIAMSTPVPEMACTQPPNPQIGHIKIRHTGTCRARNGILHEFSNKQRNHMGIFGLWKIRNMLVTSGYWNCWDNQCLTAQIFWQHLRTAPHADPSLAHRRRCTAPDRGPAARAHGKRFLRLEIWTALVSICLHPVFCPPPFSNPFDDSTFVLSFPLFSLTVRTRSSWSSCCSQQANC